MLVDDFLPLYDVSDAPATHRQHSPDTLSSVSDDSPHECAKTIAKRIHDVSRLPLLWMSL